MDPLWIAVAFVLGLGARIVGLPPLVGFLIAGFVLNYIGFEGGDTLQEIADLGVTLLLFSIGLKLKLKSLLRPEIWAGTAIHTTVIVLLFGVIIFGLSYLGLSGFAGLDPLAIFTISFALSFSSTVFAVKNLEDRGEFTAQHGRVAIGILIMQDILAVLFITISAGKMPTPYAFLLLALIPARPLLMRLIDKTGHGELLPLFGLFSALVLGAHGFELVGLKADLGALLLGMLLADHPRAKEIADSLLSFKDILLVGFFLTVGLAGVPTLQNMGIAAFFVLLLPIKIALFYLLLTGFRLRKRPALFASLNLANYSEFGLIVAVIGYNNGWIGAEWLVTLALALSATFIGAAALNKSADAILSTYAVFLGKFESGKPHADEVSIDPGNAEIIVVGVGSIGTGSYNELVEMFGEIVLGIEQCPDKSKIHHDAGRNIINGDALDDDFWEKVKAGKQGKVKVVLLAMPDHFSNLYAAEKLREIGYDGFVAALVNYPDQVEPLKELGVDVVFNARAEAGVGFADSVAEILGDRKISFSAS
jgi:predicted Kef-type K+ transport protein